MPRKQLKAITIQDPYPTKPHFTEAESVAGRGPPEPGFGAAEEDLLFSCKLTEAASLTPLLPLAGAILPLADPRFPCLPSGWKSKKWVQPLNAKWPRFSTHYDSYTTASKKKAAA